MQLSSGILILVVVFLNSVQGQWYACPHIVANDVAQYITSHSDYGYENYPSYSNRCWWIQTEDSSGSKVVELSVDSFDLQPSSGCYYDTLNVFDTYFEYGNYLQYCGMNIKTTYSSGRFMFLRFKSNDYDNYDGFRLGIKQVSKSRYDPMQWENSLNYGTTSYPGFNFTWTPPNSNPYRTTTYYPDSDPYRTTTYYPDSDLYRTTTYNPDSDPYRTTTYYPDSDPYRTTTYYPDWTSRIRYYPYWTRSYLYRTTRSYLDWLDWTTPRTTTPTDYNIYEGNPDSLYGTNEGNRDALTRGEVIGISLGVIFGVILLLIVALLVALLCIVLNRKKKRTLDYVAGHIPSNGGICTPQQPGFYVPQPTAGGMQPYSTENPPSYDQLPTVHTVDEATPNPGQPMATFPDIQSK